MVRPARREVFLSVAIQQYSGHQGLHSLLGVERLRDVDKACLEHLVDRVEVLFPSQCCVSPPHSEKF